MKTITRKETREIEIPVYICDHCGVEYSDPFVARGCEKRCKQKNCPHESIEHFLHEDDNLGFYSYVGKRCKACSYEYSDILDFEDLEDNQEFLKELYELVNKYSK